MEARHDFGEANAPYRTKLQALFAPDGRHAVVLRRGPKLHNHLLTWDLASDTFVGGQWMKGTVELWDLDPKGTKLLYWARQWHWNAPVHDEPEALESWEPRQPSFHQRGKRRKIPRYMRPLQGETVKRMALRPRRNEGVWTAVSRPPYFSALAIWPCFGHWTGGGVFEGSSTIRLQESPDGMVPKVNVPLPKWLNIRAFSELGHIRDATWCSKRGVEAGNGARFATIESALQAAGARWIEFFHEHGRDLVFGADGQVFRLQRWQSVPQERWISAAVRLVDLRPLQFERVAPPPSALSWPPRHSTQARLDKVGKKQRLRDMR